MRFEFVFVGTRLLDSYYVVVEIVFVPEELHHNPGRVLPTLYCKIEGLFVGDMSFMLDITSRYLITSKLIAYREIFGLP